MGRIGHWHGHWNSFPPNGTVLSGLLQHSFDCLLIFVPHLHGTFWLRFSEKLAH